MKVNMQFFVSAVVLFLVFIECQGIVVPLGVNTPLLDSTAYGSKLVIEHSDSVVLNAPTIPFANHNYCAPLIVALPFVNTRPDISTSVSILAQKVSQPKQNDWNELKRIVKYLKGTSKVKLLLSETENNKDRLFHGYADANWAEDRVNRKANSGYLFKLNGGVVSWSCRKQTCVALSSTEAELIALSEACQEASWIRRLLIEMQHNISGPTTIYEDNQSCLKLIQEEQFFE
ncbi:uncharacterized protein LOC129907212 [Episyrphus balteatus]|uniref:uncharacterized protein LOC129907212 n=1 Tax=Episyrphus balteatus TaxID=286459 RepID=UPI00248559BD|nr:uncharacterized protein LOC129907212 [Episyrphus balteatus]